jgi:hypothetical protein
MVETLSPLSTTDSNDQRLFVTEDEKSRSVYIFDKGSEESQNIIVRKSESGKETEERVTPDELEMRIRLAGRMPEEEHLNNIRESGIFGDAEATQKTLTALKENIAVDKSTNAMLYALAQECGEPSAVAMSLRANPSIAVNR